MAICCRSSRDLSLNAQTTPNKVGPGTYNLDSSSKKILKAAPPFQTSSTRKPFEDSRGIPAPTDYHVVNREIHRSQCGLYKSRTDRFVKEHAKSPGPNSYTLPDTWHRHSSRQTVAGGISDTVLQRLKTTIPSIPVGKQCAGYKESTSGELCLQEVNDSSFSENGLTRRERSNVDFTNFWRHGTMATFGKCRSRREVFKSDQNPGPGTYKGSEFTSPSASTQADCRSATFRSGTLLAYQMAPKDCEVSPGPAEYSYASNQEDDTNIFASFGTTQKRRYQESTSSLSAPWRFRVPGPASYSVASDFDRKTVNVHVKTRPAFCQTSDRFSGYETLQPGPGEYDISRRISRAFQFKHNAKGGFLSNQERLRNKEITLHSLTPGPTNYKSVLNWGDKDIHRTMNPSSVFASKQKRFLNPRGPTQPDYGDPICSSGSPRGDPSRLGPGCYNISKDDSWRQSTQWLKHTPFSCSDLRFRAKNYSRDEQRPGPSDYDTTYRITPLLRYPKNVYFSTQERFKDYRNSVPGPSDYRLTNTSMIKKTFNVTF